MLKTDIRNKNEELFTNLMIEKIESLSENWHQPWTNTKTSGFPQNLSGRTYNGVNAMLLYMICEKKGYRMPAFMTFNQASEMNVMIKKGEKFIYKGINCSENIIKDQIYDLRTAIMLPRI